MSSQAISALSGPEIKATIPILPNLDQFAMGTRQRSTSPGNTAGKSNQYYNKVNLTPDGDLSSVEEYVFALIHPGESTSLNMYIQYDSKGTLRINTRAMPRLINITA